MSKLLALAWLVQVNTTQLKISVCCTACSVPYSKTNATVMGTLPPRRLTSWALPMSITQCCTQQRYPAWRSLSRSFYPANVSTVTGAELQMEVFSSWITLCPRYDTIAAEWIDWLRQSCRLFQGCFPSSPNAPGHIYSGASHGSFPDDVYTGPVAATQTWGAHTGHLLGQLLLSPRLRRALAVTHSLLSHIIGRLWTSLCHGRLWFILLCEALINSNFAFIWAQREQLVKHSHIHMLLLQPAERCLPAPFSELQPTCADLASSGDFAGGFSHVPPLEGLLVCFQILQYVSVLVLFFSVGFPRKQGLRDYPVFVRERELVSF